MHIQHQEPIATVGEHYLSFAIDLSQVVGENWWHPKGHKVWSIMGSHNPGPLDFSNERLIRLAGHLAPAYLSVGGTKSDEIYYDFEGEEKKLTRGYHTRLTKKTWKDINTFAQNIDTKLVFTLNAGLGPRAKKKTWTIDNAEELLAYSKRKGYDIPVFRLGNEVNGFLGRGLHWKVSGKQYAQDFVLANDLVKEYYPSSQLIACSSSFWPVVGELLPILERFLKAHQADIDILSWHYYPQQSRRAPIAIRRAKPELMLNPKRLDVVGTLSNHIEKLRKKYTPSSALWMGETGHAQFGGEPGVSDTFVSGFWWLDQLGLLAQRGYQTVIRQALVGSNYGLLNETTFLPHPDYWHSLLWKKLMGTTVYSVNHDNTGEKLRVYAHSSAHKTGITFLCINLDTKDISVSFDAKQKEVYLVSTNDIFGETVLLNTKPLVLGKGDSLPALKPVITNQKEIVIPGRSYAFISVNA